MSFRYHPAASRELFEAVSYYEDRQQGLGERFPLRVFPYLIVYVVQPAPLIVAVAHAHRLPEYWLERTSGP